MISGLLSIVIPTYNSERFIFHNLQKIYSALENRQENFEIIIIDDGSSDKTSQELLRFYQKNYSKNITLIPLRHLKNKGQGRATLSGFQVAQGEYVATLDDDNEYSVSDLLRGFDFIREDSFTYCYIGYFKKKDRGPLREFISNSRPFINKYLLGLRGDIHFTVLRVMRHSFKLDLILRRYSDRRIHFFKI